MMENRVVLIGAGGFGREVISWARDSSLIGKFPKITFFVDDNPKALDGFDYGLHYIGAIQDYIPKDGDLFVMGVASPAIKRKIVEKISCSSSKFLTLIHPTAVVSFSAKIGDGAIICPFSLISADAVIGNFVNVNCMSSIGHDAFIGDYSTISGHVDITGQVKVGESVFFGTGASVVPRIKIGSNAQIGAGATVMRSVKDGAMMYTMPARKF